MMKFYTKTYFVGTAFLLTNSLFGQSNENCFLNDFEPKTFVAPESESTQMPDGEATVIVNIMGDSIGRVSKYVYGNAIVAWAGSYTNTEFVDGVKNLKPTLIRWPGGSWADGWFLDKIPTDVPDSVYEGTKYTNSIANTPKVKFGGHHGNEGGWVTTTEQYYSLRTKTGVNEGLITVNYGYARYGTSKDPVAQAAHEAARWVRYDAGRTKFWEIGNENGGPWEYGWMIDTALNQDGQPTFMSGELYGKHFKVFADSMRNAARETGATIYIGGQVMAGAPTGGGQWGNGDRTWNEGFFREVGDEADFYVVHNYFSNAGSIDRAMKEAISGLTGNTDYVNSEILKYNGHPKPLALTEYNMVWGNDAISNSYINGIQSVVLMCEMIKDNWGLGSRWNLETLFSGDGNYANHPHADFYYLSLLQRIYGDLAISAASTNSDILCYATRYSASGEIALVLINKGTSDQVVSIGSSNSVRFGSKYYSYTLTGGTETEYSPNVYINGEAPNLFQWGPYDQLFDIKAKGYSITDQMKINSPAKSVQMILIEGGNTQILVDGVNETKNGLFNLGQNYPNPVSATTYINYQLPERTKVTLKVFDLQGKEVSTLINDIQNEGDHVVPFDVTCLQNGIYFYSIEAGKYSETKKLVVFKF
jgi:hypothetical protein